MPKISQESIEQVVAANDIVDVIGSYFPLKRAGTSVRALCPFHREKSPSFYVNPARQSFHCFGCGAGGGVVRFVMDYEHISFPDAIRRLAARAGISLIEESNFKDMVSRDERSRLMDLHRKAAIWFHHHLLRSPQAAVARAYLKERGFSKEIAVAWQLGYAPSDWLALCSWGKSEGFKQSELIAGGLLSSAQQGKEYGRFRNRLMFPIRNDYGEVVGFSGRTLNPERDEAKYLNSPETSIFRKGHLLFGLDKSKRSLIAAGEAILLEGQIDLIAAFEHGCKNVAAPQGTAFTEDQARLLKRFVDRVILCFDSDSAGQKAIERSLPALIASGCEVRVASLPPGEDPDSLIRKSGIEAFQKIIGEAQDFFDRAVDRALSLAGGQLSPRETASLVKNLAQYCGMLPEATLREMTCSKIATRLGVSMATFLKEIPQSAFSQFTTNDKEEASGTLKKLSPAVELLCRLVLSDATVREWLRSQDSLAFHAELDVVQELLRIEETSLEKDSMALFLLKLSPSLQSLIASWDLEKKFSDPLDKAKKIWNGMQVTYWKGRQEELVACLRKAGIQSSEVIDIQKEILDLQRKIGEIVPLS